MNASAASLALSPSAKPRGETTHTHTQMNTQTHIHTDTHTQVYRHTDASTYIVAGKVTSVAPEGSVTPRGAGGVLNLAQHTARASLHISACQRERQAERQKLSQPITGGSVV